MKFVKITHLKHSGTGENATHIKVIDAFNVSKEKGIKYCTDRGWVVSLDNNCLKVISKNIFGFEMYALYTDN